MRVIRRVTPETLDRIELIADSVLTGEETLLRITRSGFSVDYMQLSRAEWRVFPPVAAADPARLVMASDAAVFAAFEDERFIGNACVRVTPEGWAEVLDLRVDAAHRRTGVGGMLLDACERFAVQRGMLGLRLSVTEDNPAMCQFCTHNGFALGGLDRMALIHTARERMKPLARRAGLLFFYRNIRQN